MMLILNRSYNSSIIFGGQSNKMDSKMENYRIIGKIGSGAYSTVWKALQLSTGLIVALKQIQIPTDELMQKRIFTREIKTLEMLGGHPNIIKLLEVFRHRGVIYLVFEYIPMDLITFYKTVKQKEKRNLTDNQITYIFKQVCSAIEFMHSKRIIHRDIKPQNILIDPMNLKVKLIDFGFSKQFHEKDINTQYIVTRWYRPIEVVLGLAYDYKVDIFSIGALLLELYNGKEVFRSSSNVDQLYWICFICGYPYWQPAIDKIKQLNLNVNLNGGPIIKNLIRSIRQEGQNLITQMLKITPHHRPSIFEILEHPYFGQKPKISLEPNNHPKSTKRTLSEYEKKSTKNQTTKKEQIVMENILQQKKPSNITTFDTYNSQKKVTTKRLQTQNNSMIANKDHKEKSTQVSLNKLNKFGMGKQTHKTQKKIQLSSLLVNKTVITKHSRTPSNNISMEANQPVRSSYNQKQPSSNLKRYKPSNQNNSIKKLYRMSGV